MFTARNRQNPFAKRRREQAEAEQQAAEQAMPVDLNPDSAEYTQAPDISTYATGGVVEAPKPTLVELSADEQHEQADPAPVAIEIPAETQAKIDAVMNRAIPSVAEQPAETPPVVPESDAKRGRGRPRPMETIVRDGKVYDLLKAADASEGVSKESIAAELNEKEQQVYSSLRQLSKEGRAATRYVKPHGYRWFAA